MTRFLGTALLAFLSVQRVLAGVIYDLDNLGGGDATVTGVNGAGQIVGYGHTSTSVLPQAFLYSNGTMQDLGTLGGNSAFASGINNLGQVVGYSETAGGDTHAFVYSGGSMQDLGTLGGTNSFALGINDAGKIVGYSYTPTSAPGNDAFLYTPGSGMTDISANSDGIGINNNGLMVLYAPADIFFKHAVTDNNGVFKDLGSVGGNYVHPEHITDSGVVVGGSQYDTSTTDYHAFLYDPTVGHMVDLGTLGGTSSWAYGVGPNGEVVGNAERGDGNVVGFLWKNGVMTDLNSYLPANSGWYLDSAIGVTDSGLIVGSGIINGQEHVFELDINAPEPGSQILFGGGALLLFFGIRRR
jgi:probable HAF family extracellular repeat protein